jgi:hypothetical protein
MSFRKFKQKRIKQTDVVEKLLTVIQLVQTTTNPSSSGVYRPNGTAFSSTAFSSKWKCRVRIKGKRLSATSSPVGSRHSWFDSPADRRDDRPNAGAVRD